jgi:curved DNA-binding protein CbpA
MKDPYRILEVTREAADDEIHQAYLAKVQAFPPDRNPVQFQAIRRAYETLKTRPLRLQYDLFDSESPELSDLIEIALAAGTPRRPSEKIIRQLVGATWANSTVPQRKNKP